MTDGSAVETSGRKDIKLPWLQRTFCADCFKQKDETATPTQEPAGQPNEEGVAVLLTIATETVADERDRGRALDAKAASLTGFTGLILSVNGALASAFLSHHLGAVGKPVAIVFFFLAIILLLAAVLLAVVGVLMPQSYRGMGRKELRNFATPAVQANSALWVRQSMLGALANIIAKDRPVNDCKARLTKGVAGLLALGFVAVAGEALTIGLRQIGV
jgi:hypothetical protein